MFPAYQLHLWEEVASKIAPRWPIQWLHWSRNGSEVCLWREEFDPLPLPLKSSLASEANVGNRKGFCVPNGPWKMTKNWEMVCLPGCHHSTGTGNWVTRCSLTESQQLDLSTWAINGVQSVWDYGQASDSPTRPTSKSLLCIAHIKGIIQVSTSGLNAI